MERTVVSTAIIPQRGFYGVGIMPRLFWKTGHASLTVTGDRIDGNQATNDSRTVLGRAHWNPVKGDRSVLHVGLWGFDEALSSAATTLTRNTVIGGRFNGALRVSTGTLLGGRSTTAMARSWCGYVGRSGNGGGGRAPRAADRRPPRLPQQGVEFVGWLVPHRRPAAIQPAARELWPAARAEADLRGRAGRNRADRARYENLDYTTC